MIVPLRAVGSITTSGPVVAGHSGVRGADTAGQLDGCGRITSVGQQLQECATAQRSRDVLGPGRDEGVEVAVALAKVEQVHRRRARDLLDSARKVACAQAKRRGLIIVETSERLRMTAGAEEEPARHFIARCDLGGPEL